MESIKYFLVLEKRLGDYNIIDINKLDICKAYVTNEIASIDFFTSLYSIEEIKASVMRGNILQPDYINGTLKVISDKKHNLKALTKDIFSVVREFQSNCEALDRDFKNKVFGVYKKVIESTFEDKSFIQGMLDRFKLSLKDGSKKDVFGILEELPYAKSRIIYFNIFEEITRKKEKNLRKLEKLDDAL